MAFNNLKDKARKLNSEGGVPFMEGRIHGGSMPCDEIVHVDKFGFINGTDGKYVVLGIKEEQGAFYFGGGVVTEKFETLKGEMTPGDEVQMEDEGIPVRFTMKQNKTKKREYMTCEFFPEEIEEKK